ncbi:peptidylprolyl isomerase [Candidatus Pelagibacter sp.]|nr:peptidylprolyl isomerase [Candidatus Pelagibacter sp.]
MNKIRLIALIIIIINLNFSLVAEIYTAYKIDGEIITNVDIEKESQYLMALNNQLKNLKREKITEIARESLIKEKIKKIELLKYFVLDRNNPLLDVIIREFYTKLDLNNVEEFKNYLKDYNLTIEEIKDKIEIETTWNKLIFEKYKYQVNVDEKLLKKKIFNKEQSTKEKSYSLSEIVFEKKKDKTIKQLIEEINKSIKDIGFENTANIYSINDSSKFGGNIGWLKEKNLIKVIYKEVNGLKIGELTKPIQVGKGLLILKINNIRIETSKIDSTKEMKKIIELEKNRQLEQYSMIYFNKIKINTNVEKL